MDTATNHDAGEPDDAPLTVADNSRRRLDHTLGLIPSRLSILTLGLLLGVVGLVVFGLLAEDVYTHETIILDKNAGYFLHGYSTPWLDATMHWLSFIGTFPVLTLIFLAVSIWLARIRHWLEVIFLAVALAGGALLNQVLKLVFERHRPTLPWSPHALGYSFPSGHSMDSFVFYFALATVLWIVLGRRVGLVAMALAAVLVTAIGISRIYLGYHYFSDVVGGYSAGLVWVVSSATSIESGRSYVHRWLASRDIR